jgi:hypothetical protein
VVFLNLRADGFHGSSQTLKAPKLGFLYLQEKHKHGLGPITRMRWGLARPCHYIFPQYLWQMLFVMVFCFSAGVKPDWEQLKKIKVKWSLVIWVAEELSPPFCLWNWSFMVWWECSTVAWTCGL